MTDRRGTGVRTQKNVLGTWGGSLLPPAPASWSASCSCLLPLPPGAPAGRALLVAALLVSAYVLVRYWRGLGERPATIRRRLVGLRAVTLLLVSCALAGLSFEYSTTSRERVLLVSSSNVAKVERPIFQDNDPMKRVLIAALKSKGFEVAEDDEANVEDGGFVAAVLLTDGATSPSDAANQIERTRSLIGGAPVYAAESIREVNGPSVTLETVKLLGPALRGVPLAVRCTVHSRGLQGRETIITVSDDAKVQASARLAWTSNDQRQAATLTLVPKTSGWAAYTAKVEAAGAEDAAGLSRPFTLYVEERQARVLFFEGEPTWESKFIRRALDQSGLFEVDYFAQVSRAATVGTSTEDQTTASEDAAGKSVGAPDAKLHAILRSQTALNVYDSVVVGASPNALLSGAESARLGLWVERRGGGLIVLGGNSFNGSVASRGGRLSWLLPAEAGIQNSSQLPLSQGRPLEAENVKANLFLTPTEDGMGALAGYMSASEGTLKASLGGQGFRLGALRPGATILAVAGPPNANGTSDEGQPLIAAMNYGAGRTLVFAPADSWRMRTNASGEEDRIGGQFNSLWQGLVIWAGARSRPASEIMLSDDSPGAGSEVTAEVRVRDTSFSPVKLENVNVRIQGLSDEGSETEAQEVAFAPNADDPSIWRGRLRLNAPGKFALRADYVAGGRSESIEKRFAVITATPRASGASFDTLRRVSRATGGDFITSTELEAFAGRLAAAGTTREPVHLMWEVRSWWPLALIVPLVLSAEWFLRRWWRID